MIEKREGKVICSKCGCWIDEYDEDGNERTMCDECYEEWRMAHHWHLQQEAAIDHAIHSAIENGD